MSRIRSVHPGLFTDEAFVSLSMTARLLLIGIWTECDDRGVFERKPLTLKMKVFPADNLDVGALMLELEAANVVRAFSVDGRDFGAVRNFCRYQRPKKPTFRYPAPNEVRTYVGCEDMVSVPVPHQSGRGTEIGPQMEDGGGKEKTVGDARARDPKPPLLRTEAITLGNEVIEVLKPPNETAFAGLPYQCEVWLSAGYDRNRVLAVVSEIAARRKIPNLAYLKAAIERSCSTPTPAPVENRDAKADRSAIGGADRLVAKLAEFDQPPPGTGGPGQLRGGTDAPPVRLLSQG